MSEQVIFKFKNKQEVIDTLKILQVAEDLKIKAFPKEKVIEIEGIRYTYELFKSWGKDGFPVGAVFKIIKKENGVFRVEKLNKKIWEEIKRKKGGDS